MYGDPRSSAAVAPRYQEAYPALKLVGVRTRFRENVTQCEWHDRHGEVVGRMEVNNCSDLWLDMVHETAKGHRRWIMALLTKPTLTGLTRPYAVCEGCRLVTPVLYYVGDLWRCAKCQGLVQLQTLLSRSQKMLLQFRALYEEVGGPNYAAMASRSYDAKRLKMEVLRSRLELIGVTELPEALRPRVDTNWLGPDDELSEFPIRSVRYRPDGPAPNIPHVSPWFGQN